MSSGSQPSGAESSAAVIAATVAASAGPPSTVVVGAADGSVVALGGAVLSGAVVSAVGSDVLVSVLLSLHDVNASAATTKNPVDLPISSLLHATTCVTRVPNSVRSSVADSCYRRVTYAHG